MNKKKIIYLLALAALLFTATACQQEEDPTVGKAKVTFIAELPDLPEHLDSRAIGDGDYANELFLWVYDDEGREIQGLRHRFSGQDCTCHGLSDPWPYLRFRFLGAAQGHLELCARQQLD